MPARNHNTMTKVPGRSGSASWVDDGDEYAVIALRVRPETSGRIAEFSEHEAD
jgi:hypothetical protein